MAGVKRSRNRAHILLSKTGFIRTLTILLTVTGTLHLPIPFEGKTTFAVPHNIKPGPVNPNNFTWEQFSKLIMKPQVKPESDLNKGFKDSFEDYQNQQVSNDFANTFEDKVNDDTYTGNLNEIDMDNLSRSRDGGNITVLDNSDLQSGKVDNGTLLTKWDNSTVPETWWSACRVPVIIILVGVIGVLVIAVVVILWLRKQMHQSDKQGNGSDSDSNEDNQLMSVNCPCPSPSPGQVQEEQWICHPVINLKNPIEGTTEEAVQVQPKDTVMQLVTQPQPPPQPAKEEEKKPEAPKMKAKGLLERRGSCAALTIDLTQNTLDTKFNLITPTEEECDSEEYLLSAGNIMSRAQLRHTVKSLQYVHSEFWEIPLNHPDKSEITGCGLKNRYETILPNEKTRVKLGPVTENLLETYINANYIRGFNGEEKTFIATQGPLSNTVQDFYKMAWNDFCPIIVMITKFNEKTKNKCEVYFPQDMGDFIKCGDFEVTVSKITEKEGYTVRELLVRKNTETRLMIHYWCDTWPDHKTPDEASGIIQMALDIETTRLGIKNKTSPYLGGPDPIFDGPIIVHCSAGIGRTGCFIGICIGMKQLQIENKVDVLGIVCQMRYDRGGMVQTAEQYEFLHQALAEYAETLPEPANI